jgi:hypothetical protein
MFHGGPLTWGTSIAIHWRLILEVMGHYSRLLWSCFHGAAPFGEFYVTFFRTFLTIGGPFNHLGGFLRASTCFLGPLGANMASWGTIFFT